MSEAPKDKNVPFDRGAFVQVWEYLENGYSRVVINDIPYITKIARSKTECDIFPPSPKYCWADVIEEPVYYEWKQISLTEDGQKFWVLNRKIDGSGIISVKDEAVNVHRLVNTKYRKEQEEIRNAAGLNPDEVDSSEEEVEVEEASLFDPEVMKDIKMPENEYAQEFLQFMKDSKKNKNEEEVKKDPEPKLDVKIQGENEPKDIQMNFGNNNSTQNTINVINKQQGQPLKLDLKPNQPFNLE